MHSAEAVVRKKFCKNGIVVRRCSVKKVFLEFTIQNSQENACARAAGQQLFKKRDSGTGVFLWIMRIF